MNISKKHKIALSRFRLSNHQLMIEKGRHLDINRNNRNCLFCKNIFEDEEHFLMACALYSKERKILENNCNKICMKYTELTNEEKFIYIMSNENDEIIKVLAKFVHDSLSMREKMIWVFDLTEK